MSAFQKYMKGAKHYLFPKSYLKDTEQQRQEFINYCEQYGLDLEFGRQIKQNPKWAELAQVSPVYFFEDTFSGDSHSLRLPQLKLLITDCGTAPVIKVLKPGHKR